MVTRTLRHRVSRRRPAMIAAYMADYRIVPTSRFDRGCRCFTVGGR